MFLTTSVLLHLGYRLTYFGTSSITADCRAVYSDVQYDAEKELGLKGGLIHRFVPRFGSMADALLGGMKDAGRMGPGIPNSNQSPTFLGSITWVRDKHMF